MPERAVVFLVCTLVLVVASFDVTAGDPPETPDAAWRFVTGGQMVGTVAYESGGTGYFAAEDRYLYALDPNGRMVWRTDLGRRPAGSVIVGVDGTIYVTLDDGDLLALNRDGGLIWRERITAGRPLAPVVTSNGVVVTVRRPGTLEARTHAGRLVWSVDLGMPVSVAPILATGGNLVVAGAAGNVALVSVDGRVNRRRFVGGIGSSLACNGTDILLGTTDGGIIALDHDLELLWQVDTGSAIRDLVVGSTADVYATGDDGSLSRISSDGALVWTMSADTGHIVTVIAAADLVAATREGMLETITPDGRRSRLMQLADQPVSVSVSPHGKTVISTRSWVTYAYPTDFTPDGFWPEERGGMDRRGVYAGSDRGRLDPLVFERSVDYVVQRSMIETGGQTEQIVAMADLAARVRSGADLADRHQHMLLLSETIAGSPFFGELDRFRTRVAPRRAREEAIFVLGEIGDLVTSRFLAKLLSHETDSGLQAAILRSMAQLGTPLDRELASRLAQIVRTDIVRGASDPLAESVTAFVEAVNVYRGGYIHADVAYVLLMIAQGPYSRHVRVNALDMAYRLGGETAP